MKREPMVARDSNVPDRVALAPYIVIVVTDWKDKIVELKTVRYDNVNADNTIRSVREKHSNNRKVFICRLVPVMEIGTLEDIDPLSFAASLPRGNA